MLRDRLLFGALAGLAANQIMNLFEYLLWKLKVIKYMLGHYAASLFLEAEATHHTQIGAVVSFIADNIYSTILGVIFLFLLPVTGKRFILAKGFIYGLFLWFFSYGGLRSLPMVQLRKVPADSWEIVLYLLLHLVFGLALAWFTQKYGPDLEEKRD